MSNYRIRDLSTYIVLKVKLLYYRPQRSCEGYVFTGVCLSTGGMCHRSMHCRWYPSMPCSRSRGGGVLYQHALQVVCQHTLQQVSKGGCLLQQVPAWGGCLLGQCLLQGDLLPGDACSGGVWRPPCPESRRLLLRTVRILLECILVL